MTKLVSLDYVVRTSSPDTISSGSSQSKSKEEAKNKKQFNIELKHLLTIE